MGLGGGGGGLDVMATNPIDPAAPVGRPGLGGDIGLGRGGGRGPKRPKWSGRGASRQARESISTILTFTRLVKLALWALKTKVDQFSTELEDVTDVVVCGERKDGEGVWGEAGAADLYPFPEAES